MGGIYGLVLTNVPFFVGTLTMLRSNMLAHILKRPGASALPDSPGEAISRFRGDVFEIPLFALWLNDINGLLVSGGVALTIMFSINAKITFFATLPFIVVAFLSTSFSREGCWWYRLQRASRRVVDFRSGELHALRSSSYVER